MNASQRLWQRPHLEARDRRTGPVGLGAPMSSIVAILFAGAFFCNCIPHLASGLRGEPFPTPFARPRGVGNSSPLANVLWGTANLAVALALGSGTAAPDRAPHLAAAAAVGGLCE